MEAKIRFILKQIEEGIAQDRDNGEQEQAPEIDSEELKERIKKLNKFNAFDKKSQ